MIPTRTERRRFASTCTARIGVRRRDEVEAVYERPVATTSLDVVLDEQCGPGPSDAFILSGTIAHVPLTTGWLDGDRRVRQLDDGDGTSERFSSRTVTITP